MEDDKSDDAPHPCFETSLKKFLKTCKRRKEKFEEEFDCSIEDLAEDIRDSQNYQYIADEKVFDNNDDDNNTTLYSDLSDAELVKRCLSVSGCGAESFFWSECRGALEQGTCTWHCKRCGTCQDWRQWHCKKCDKCNYGQSVPCRTCQPELFEDRMKGW